MGITSSTSATTKQQGHRTSDVAFDTANDKDDSNQQEDTSSSTANDVLPQAYNGWWHPHRSLTDFILETLFLQFLLPTSKLCQLPPNRDDQATQSQINDMRQSLNKMSSHQFKGNKSQGFHLWSKTASSPIVEVLYDVPRPKNLVEMLKGWDLVGRSNSDETQSLVDGIPVPDGGIRVHLFFPTSVLKDGSDVELSGGESEFGFHKMDASVFNAHGVLDDAPILIYFHGGGCVMGSAYDSDGISLFVKSMALDASPNSNVVIASVEYALAPEYPFPTACLESLQVAAHFIEQLFPNNPIHVGGVSAGGYLAVVVAQECYRRYGKDKNVRRNNGTVIESCAAMIPMLDPACDSLSYYMTSNTSPKFKDFLKWCWQAFLELEVPSLSGSPGNDAPPSVPKTLDELLGLNSNRTAWQKSKWYGTPLERLAKPISGFPFDSDQNGSIDGDDAAPPPKFLVVTNKADALSHEGKEYYEKLKKTRAVAISARHLDHEGTHWMGTILDSKAYDELIAAWKQLVFD